MQLTVIDDQLQYATPMSLADQDRLIDCVIRDLPARWERQSPPTRYSYNEAVDIAASASRAPSDDAVREHLAYLILDAIPLCRGELVMHSQLP